MIALRTIATVKPYEIYDNLPLILDVTQNGSVISRDNGVGVLINLAENDNLYDSVITLLFEQLKRSPSKQLPMYAEQVLPVIRGNERNELSALLLDRMGELEKDSQKRRLARVIKKLSEE